MLIGRSRYSLGCCGTSPCACASARWLCNCCANALASATIIDSNHLDGFISILLVNLFATRRGLTVELTRRRESKHPSPHQAGCERRSRRSRPTIGSARAKFTKALLFVCRASWHSSLPILQLLFFRYFKGLSTL